MKRKDQFANLPSNLVHIPRVSVVLTSFNHANYICEAIDSALNQTFTDFELIIWDDASSDNSWDLINQYSDPRVKAFRNEAQKRGVWGINKAISEIASGEFIAIHHSDDIWEPTKLAEQVAFLDRNHDVGAVFTNASIINEEGRPFEDGSHFYYTIFDQPNRTSHEWLNYFYYRGNALCHPSVMIRRQCYSECGLYRYGLAQVADFDMWIRLCLKYQIHVLPQKLVRFRVRAGEANTSGNRPEVRIRCATEFFLLFRNYLDVESFDDFVAIFPEAKLRISKKGFVPGFVLSMLALEDESLHMAKAFSVLLLFELLWDVETSKKIKAWYGFDYLDLIKITGQHDIFSLEAVAGMSNSLTERNGQIARLNEIVAERDGQIARLNEIVAERDGQIANLNHAVVAISRDLQTILSSRSWKITRILRLAGRIYRRDWAAVQASIRSRQEAKESSVVKEEGKCESQNTAVIKELEPKPCALTPPALSVDTHHKRILLVSYYCPSRAHGGGLRILDIYSLIKASFSEVKIDLYTHKRPEIDWSYSDIEQIFDQIYFSPVEKLSPGGLSELSGAPRRYDVIDLQFHQSAHHLDQWRTLGGKILFTPMESLVRSLATNVRATLRRETPYSLRNIIAGIKSAAEEIVFASKVDEVVCVSRLDASLLRFICQTKKINYLETAISNIEFSNAIGNKTEVLMPEHKKNTILYVAYFGSETNIVALKWYLENIHSLIKKAVPEYKLQIVGRGDLTIFNDYQSDSIEFVGEVPTLAPYIGAAKVGIAPALGGSGFRGKINQYAIFGVPSVASSVSAKGLAYEDGIDIYIADEPDIFANRCIRLLMDNQLNKTMGQQAREKAFSEYSWESKIDAIRKIYTFEEA